jgi:exopolysaccharide biosynthesis polyprenyl glycosylphosphotransferase
VAAASVVQAEAFQRAAHAARLNSRRLFVFGTALDAVASAVALIVSGGAGWLDRPATAAGSAVLVAATISGIAVRQNFRRLRTGVSDDLEAIGMSASIAFVLGAIAQVVFAAAPSPSVKPLLAVAAVEVAAITAAHVLTNSFRSRLLRPAPTLIVGAGQIGRLVGQRLLSQPRLGLRPVGFLDKDPRDAGSLAPGAELPVLGASWDLEDVVRAHGIEYVVVTFSTAPTEVLLSLLRRCEDLGLDVALVPRLFEKVPRRVAVHHLGALPLLQVHPANPNGLSFELKHLIDRVFAALLVPLLAPALLFSAASVWLSLGRPILFRQRRVGRGGEPFDMLKFRTMAAVRESEWQQDAVLEKGLAPGGVEGADRRTRVGAILRRTSLDELPQLFNVLKGEMSFIGPRPERPEFVEVFNADVYRYDDRHRVRAGITGWSQVNGLRGKTSIRDRAEWDNYYIENWSFGMDLRILASTVRAMFAPGSAE